jgi:hypothetical protein
VVTQALTLTLSHFVEEGNAPVTHRSSGRRWRMATEPEFLFTMSKSALYASPAALSSAINDI